jgi:uncharacterized coiled-coil protein SlyX
MIKKSIVFFSLFVIVLLSVQARPQEIDLRHQLVKDKGLIQGTVKSADGQPIPGATVIFKNTIPKFTTLADGRFVGRMYAGSYTVFAYKIGYKTLIKDNVEIIADSTTNIDIILEPDPVNLGRGAIAGRITDQKDEPISDAKVIIAESFVPKSDDIVTIEDFILKAAQIEASSDRDGNFIIKNVPPGRFTAFAMKDGYQSFMYFSIYVETGQTKTIEAKLSEQKYSFIYGKVKSTDGEAIPGANITLTGTRLGAASDPLGNFIIKEVPPGKYILKVAMLGFNPYQQSIAVEKNKHQKLAVTIEPDISFKLEKKSDLQAYEDRLEELRQAYFLAESETDRDETRKQIRALLETMFDLKEKEYAKNIEAKKRNIQSLEQLQKYRAENKDDIIERRLKELLTVY